MILNIKLFKRLKLFFALFIVSSFVVNTVNAQLIIDPPISNQTQADDIVKKVLIGKGVVATNIKWSNNTSGQQISSFRTDKEPTNLGIKSGIVLSTGNVTNVNVITDSLDAGTDWCGGTPGCQSDADLETIIKYPDGTTDAAVLEFDFVPSSTPVRFRYVFASKEYPFYVCSMRIIGKDTLRFNDGFAFLLSGNGYNKKNIAIVPGSKPELPVAIYTVNPGVPGTSPTGQHYKPEGCKSLSYKKYYVNNLQGTTVNFNGFTTVLTAQADVIPCETYHIKIAIADVGDGTRDSGVFLEASSFSSEDSVVVDYTKPQIDSVAVKECNDAIIKFSIAKPTTTETKINFIVQSTATRGTDFTLTPNNDFVVIPAGSTSQSITLHANASGPASYKVNFRTVACTVLSDSTYSVKVISHPELKATPSEGIAVCGGQSKEISVVGSGGLGNKTYQWSSNPAGFSSGVSNPTVSPLETTTYTCIVSDVCGTVTASVIVTVIPLPVLKPNGPLAFCPGDTAMLKANTYEGYQYQWTKDGTNIDGETNSSFIADSSGTYNVVVSVGEECVNTSNTITITMKEFPDTTKYKVFSIIKPADEITNSNRYIKGTSPFDVSFNYSGNEDEIVWDFGDNNTDTKKTVNHSFKYDAAKASNGQTIYHVSLTIGTGNCARTIKFDVIVQSAILEKVPDIITPDKSNCNSNFHITGTGIGKVEVSIFDRWGLIVHEKTYDFTSEKGSNLCPALGQDGGLSYYSIWDGKNKNGGKVSAGVYFYVIKPFGIDGSELEPKEGKLKGSITLIR